MDIGWKRISYNIAKSGGISWDISLYRMLENWGRNRGALDDDVYHAAVCFKDEATIGLQKRTSSLTQLDLLSIIDEKLIPASINTRGKVDVINPRVNADEYVGIWICRRNIQNTNKSTFTNHVLAMQISEIGGFNLLSVKIVRTHDSEGRDIPFSGVIFRENSFRHLIYLWDMEEFRFSILEAQSSENEIRICQVGHDHKPFYEKYHSWDQYNSWRNDLLEDIGDMIFERVYVSRETENITFYKSTYLNTEIDFKLERDCVRFAVQCLDWVKWGIIQ